MLGWRLRGRAQFSRKSLLVFGVLFALVGGTIIYLSLAVNSNLPGDCNNDNTVNATDLSSLLSSFNSTTSLTCDFNGDKTINGSDLSVLLTNYGKSFSPPTVGAEWSWDATKATLNTNSASLVSAMVQYWGGGPYFFTEPATADVYANTPTYTIDTTKVFDKYGHLVGKMDPTIWVPVGTEASGGVGGDAHLMIWDHVRGRWHDFWHATFDSNGHLYTYKGGYSMAANKVNPPYIEYPIPGYYDVGATATDFPLARGIVTPDEVKAGVIPHALAVVMANLGPRPASGITPYPSNPNVGGYKTGNWGQWSGQPVDGSYPPDNGLAHIPLGTWLRMNPNATLPSTATRFEQILFTTLKQYGMFVRDRGPNMTLHGADATGGGRSIPAWNAAGVNVDSTGVLKLNDIPWSQLQVLNPPTN